MALKLSDQLLQTDIYLNTLDDFELQAKQNGFNDEDQSFPAWLNREIWDHDDELLEAKGWDMSVWDLNPMLMWAHNYDAKPLGVGQWAVRKLKEEPPGLLWRPSFTKVTDEGVEVYKLYKARVLRAFSAGFKPKEIDRDSDKKGRWIYKKMLLLEGSAVPIPANFLSLTLALQNDFIKSKILKTSFEDVLSRTDPRLFQTDISDREVEYIEKSLGKLKIRHKSISETWLEEIDHQKPYPNEHACRLASPEGADRCFRNHVNDPDNKKPFDQIICYYDGKSKVQALRYKKDVWTASEARAHCRKHDPISFEPASSESAENPENITTKMDIPEELQIFMNDMNSKMDEMKKLLSKHIDIDETDLYDIEIGDDDDIDLEAIEVEVDASGDDGDTSDDKVAVEVSVETGDDAKDLIRIEF